MPALPRVVVAADFHDCVELPQQPFDRDAGDVLADVDVSDAVALADGCAECFREFEHAEEVVVFEERAERVHADA